MRFFALASLCLLGCAAGTVPDPEAPTHLEDRGEPTPEATMYGETGGSVALVVRSPQHGVLEHVLDTLGALMEGDRNRLDELLASSLLRVTPSVSDTRRARAAVLSVALNPSRRNGLTPGMALERLVVVDDLRILPLSSMHEGALPADLDPSDVSVLVPLTDEGRLVFRSILPGWNDFGRFVVSSRAPFVVKGL